MSQSIVDDYHLPVRLTCFHEAVGFADLFELEDARRLGLKFPFRNLARDILQWHIGERKSGCAKNKTAKEREIDPAGHLQEQIEFMNGIEAAKPAREASFSTAFQHVERIDDHAISGEVKDGIELFRLPQTVGHLRPFDFTSFDAESLQLREALLAPCGCDHTRTGVDSLFTAAKPAQEPQSEATAAERLPFEVDARDFIQEDEDGPGSRWPNPPACRSATSKREHDQ